MDSLLKKTNAPFRLTYKTPDDYVKDLELIERLGSDDYFCSPLDLHHEMCEIFTGQMVCRDESAISFKRNETLDNTSLMIYGRSFDYAMETLEGMIASWASDIHYDAANALSQEMEETEKRVAKELGQEPDLPNYDSPTKVNEDEKAFALAKELGEAKAQANKPISEQLGSMVK